MGDGGIEREGGDEEKCRLHPRVCARLVKAVWAATRGDRERERERERRGGDMGCSVEGVHTW